MDDYFERFNSNKVAAIKTIVYEAGMDLRQAKELVDREFARRQKNLHTTTKRSLNTQIAEHNKRKAELDKQGIAYCPKCLSTSITADKKRLWHWKGRCGSLFGRQSWVDGWKHPC